MADKVLIVSAAEKEKIHEVICGVKTEAEIEDYMNSLKDWIKKQPHLPQNEDEHILYMMLVLNKFSLERTKGKLEVFYSGKQCLPEFFENYFPLDKRIQKVLDKSMYLPIPYLTPETNYRITITKFTTSDLDDFEPIDYIRLLCLTTEVRVNNDYCVGDITLIDFENVSLALITKCSPRIMQSSFNFLTGSFTDRIKSINFINVPTFAYGFITLMKSIMKNKIAERVHIHKDLDSLHQQIPKSCLPKELGGDLKSLNEIYSDWRKFLESQNAWFLERSKMKSNEKLRVGEPFKSEMFGLNGSFQKLVID